MSDFSLTQLYNCFTLTLLYIYITDLPSPGYYITAFAFTRLMLLIRKVFPLFFSTIL